MPPRSYDPSDDSSGGGTGLLTPPEAPTHWHELELPSFVGDGASHGGGDDGGDGFGGGGGGDDGHGTPWGGDPEGTDAFGLRLGIAGIVVMFLVFLAVWLLLRKNAPQWPPALSPAPPDVLWLSTAVLCASSVTLMGAVRAEAERRHAQLVRGLGWSVLLGTGFLAAQALLWTRLSDAGLLPSTNGYGTIFYALTALHGLHVLVGLGVLGRLFFRAWLAPAVGVSAHSLRLGATYWHSMGMIWLVLFGVLYFVR